MGKARNTNYIFTFGNFGVGKSTLMAAICSYIQDSPEVRLRKNVDGNQEGMRLLMNDWMTALKKRQYPPQSRKGMILNIDVGLQGVGESKIIPITFLEMSGEDLNALDIRYYTDESEFNSLKSEFISYLKETKICLIVTSVETAESDDLLIDQFFEWLERYQVKSPILLVVSKWDKLEKKIPVDEFIKTRMPSTSKWLVDNNVGDCDFKKFSIGKTENDNKIISINLKDAEDISHWIAKFLYS